MGWARLQLFYDKAEAVHGGEEELPLLLYVMERNNMIRQMMYLLAIMLGGPKKAKAAAEDIDQILHLADAKQIEEELEKRQAVFDAWTDAEPFEVKTMPTVEEMLAKAREADRANRSRFKDFSKFTDSIIPEVP